MLERELGREHCQRATEGVADEGRLVHVLAAGEGELEEEAERVVDIVDLEPPEVLDALRLEIAILLAAQSSMKRPVLLIPGAVFPLRSGANTIQPSLRKALAMPHGSLRCWWWPCRKTTAWFRFGSACSFFGT
jgi:hypothetical protein